MAVTPVSACEVRNILAMADELPGLQGVRETIGAAEVEEAEESLAGQATEQLEPDAVDADDDVALGVSVGRDRILQTPAERVCHAERHRRRDEPHDHHEAREQLRDFQGESREQQDGHHAGPLEHDAGIDARQRLAGREAALALRRIEDAARDHEREHRYPGDRWGGALVEHEGAEHERDDRDQRIEVFQERKDCRLDAAEPHALLGIGSSH